MILKKSLKVHEKGRERTSKIMQKWIVGKHNASCLPYANFSLYNSAYRYSCVCAFIISRAWCWQDRVRSGQLVLWYTFCPVAQSPLLISNISKRDGDAEMWFPLLPWQPLECERWPARNSRVMDWKALSSESLFHPPWSAGSWEV